MTPPARATPEVLDSWVRLAEATLGTLEAAGLPTWRLDNGGATAAGTGPGAWVDVDPFAEAGGVYVSWQPSALMAERAIGAIDAGHLDDPSIERAGRTSIVMVRAVAALLSDAGFTVIETDPASLRPLQIQVIAGPTEPADNQSRRVG